ncbi:translation factor [Hesseltinella vesiculosa]|uniref:Threonylcarbamoyl-AMP synthase n=1 Tax=Hesseltinella vesiculosa TaxID=101127 RepID=A0A1X2GCH9_9FUNG|nr:translation factor [Hesseltinella vesiculosa]
MKTNIVKVNANAIQFKTNDPQQRFGRQNAHLDIADANDQKAIDQAVAWLRQGEAIGIPTETVYGLAANALDPSAVAKIFAAKNRPQDNPLIVHVSSLTMLEQLVPEGKIPAVYLPVIESCWPGALTIILPTSSIIPSSVTCGQTTVAVRMPSHPVARAVIDQCGFPLAAPSANSSGKPSPTLASHVYDDLQGKIPLIVDGGSCDVGVESTVLDGLRQPPAILRPGGLTYETLQAFPGMDQLQVYRKHFIDQALEAAPTTPGMKYRHYSPEAMVVLIEDTQDFDQVWPKELQALSSLGMHKVGLLTSDCKDRDVPASGVLYSMGANSEQVARHLFQGLRDMDAQGVDVIFVQGVSEDHQGMAIMNRLRKAATKTIS